jgi:HK97 family phage major capsid protein
MSALSSALENELKGLNDQISKAETEASTHKETADKLVAEMRESGVNPLTDKDAFDKVQAAYLPGDTAAQTATELRSRRDWVLSQHADITPKIDPNVLNGNRRRQSVVERMQGMPEYERAAKLATSNAQFGTLPDVEFASREELRTRMTAGLPIMAAGADASDIVPIDQRLYPPVAIPVRQVRLLDLITVGATDTDLVRWSKQTVRTDAAAAVAIKTAAAQSTYTWVKQDTPVVTIAHFAKAPRENLADIAQLQTLIESQLSYGLQLKVESEVASGDGTGENFTGIYSDSDTDAFSIVRDTTNERRLMALHRGLTAVRLNLFDEPTAIGIHPTDYHEMLTEESSAGGFLMTVVANAMESRSLFGLPTVVSTIFPQNTPLVGNYKVGATMWLREGGSIRISDSNEDDFLTRQLAVLAELRAGFAVQQPRAFCKVKQF